jgi:hypothetical protein
VSFRSLSTKCAAGACVLAACSALDACGPNAREAVGVSNGGKAEPVTAATNPAAQAMETFTLPPGLTPAFAGRFVSVGHAGMRFTAELEGNPLAKEAMAKDAVFPLGAVLLMRHFERSEPQASDAGAPTGPVLLMEKIAAKGTDNGMWMYNAYDSKGRRVPADQMERCAWCHKDAPKDSYFRPKLSN